jgi:16S rRNA (adenine1518-N6/adenine1519-N6)-dimethyltransferase
VKLTTIRDTLTKLGREPKQSLGQNFLHDQNVASWIVDQLDLQPGEPWVELGPGLGALTEFAVAKSTNGILIEKDGHLVSHLQVYFPQCEIIHADALEFDVRNLFARGPVKVLGNLPYYVSSQILIGFTAEPSPVSKLVFTLQKELAQRLSAEPSTKAYGALTLLLGRRWNVQFARKLPPTVFMPAPKVDSAVVVLTPRPPGDLPPCDGAAFKRFVKRGFAQRRKLLRKNIGDEIKDWPAVCQHVGIIETARAEELSLAQWIALVNFVTGATDHSAQDIHAEIFDVVDEADRIIGLGSRHNVHLENLRHRAVHIFVFNAAGELFLQRRSAAKDKHPLLWDSSAAGHVNSGHTYDDTAPRELTEELGIEAPCTPIADISASENTGWEFVRLYRAEHEGPFILAPAEIDSGSFFTKDQIQAWTTSRPQDFAPGFLECWRLYRLKFGV